MHVAQAHLHGQLARRWFEKTIQQLQNALLFFQRVEQLPQLFARQVQVQPYQIAGAFQMNLRRNFNIQETLGVQRMNRLRIAS